MTKSELFKAAHKLAKAYKAVAKTGDYIVYFSVALKKLTEAAKARSNETIFKAVNKQVRNAGLECFITYTKKINATHGLREFKKAWMLEKAAKELNKGEFFGQTFVNKSGMICAWVREIRYEQEAY